MGRGDVIRFAFYCTLENAFLVILCFASNAPFI